MVGQFRLQRSLQDCFRELFQKAVLADDVFRLLVIGQQLINECLVDGHRFPFSSPMVVYTVPFTPSLFSSLLKCGVCGARMTITSSTKNDATYGCFAHRFRGACPNAICIRWHTLEQQLID